MKKLLLFLLTAALIGAAASAGWQEMPLADRLIQIEAAEAMPAFAQELRHEAVAVQAALLNFVDDRELLLKAQAALLSRPALARRVFPLYAAEPEFKLILKSYGDSILPPIVYFLDNKVRTLELQHYAAYKAEEIKSATSRILGKDATGENSEQPAYQELAPAQRGWHAVNLIQANGHGFLGQFTTDANERVHWLQTERLTEGAASFFTGGIRNLELKTKTSQDVTAGDVGWATLDALIFVSALKILRAGKAATAGSRSSALAARLGRAAPAGLRTAKWLAPVAVTYLVIRHPGIINDLLAKVAKILDLPVQLVQLLGWTIVLLPLLYLLSWINRLLIRPALLLLHLGTGVLLWPGKRARRTGPASRRRAGPAAPSTGA